VKNIYTLLIAIIGLSAHAQINKPIGINISAVNDYSTELTFTDAFKQCRKWISSNAAGGGAWNTQINIPLNANGYPLEIPFNDGTNPPQLVKTLMLWDIGAAVPKGLYRLIVNGNGQVRLSNGASGTFACPVDTLVNVTGQVILEITLSVLSNPINNIKFIYPDYVNHYQTQTFTNEFLSFLDDFQVIRFMDFTHTNGSPIVNWSDRTSPSFYSQANIGGAAWEYVIELANTTQKDVWINVPHKANDNYIQQLASMLQSNLNPNIKIYLEYSNEVWNAAFSQHSDCAGFAQSLGYTGQTWERAWKYTAKRSADVFKIFEDVFSNDQRLVKIIPSQAVNSWLTNQLVTFFNDPLYNPSGVKANAIAIAPYFGYGVADNIVANNQVNTINVQQIIQELKNSMSHAFQTMLDNKTIATTHNLQLLCYEGGQHLVATGNNMNDNALTQKLIATNHDAELQDLYCDYFDYWYSNIGELFCHFSSHGTYSKFGSWGVKENFQDVDNPKYLALQNCVFNANTTSLNEIAYESNLISVFPNPANVFLIVSDKHNTGLFEYKLLDFSGKNIDTGISKFGEKLFLPKLTPGFYMIAIKTVEGMQTRKIIIE
jgi:hypothetical protein